MPQAFQGIQKFQKIEDFLDASGILGHSENTENRISWMPRKIQDFLDATGNPGNPENPENKKKI